MHRDRELSTNLAENLIARTMARHHKFVVRPNEAQLHQGQFVTGSPVCGASEPVQEGSGVWLCVC